MTNEFSNYSNSKLLKAMLRAVVNNKRVPRAEIACFFDGAASSATAGMDIADNDHTLTEYPAKVGCLAKFITTTLIGAAQAEGKIKLEENLAALLPETAAKPEYRARLELLRVIELLNHTHGFDDSVFNDVPRLDNGLIDSQTLLAGLLDVPPLMPVRDLYSYGNAGVWVAAALLEKAYGMPYHLILREKLFARVGIDANALCDDAKLRGVDICPAAGNELRITASELIKVARYHMQPAESAEATSSALGASMQDLRTHTFQPTGWQFEMHRACLGQNEYGAGWYGHNAKMDGDSAIVRYCPERNMAIAVTASHPEGSAAVLGGLFSKLLPEFSKSQPPKFLSPEDWLKADSSTYAGTFESAMVSIVVDTAANKSLRVRAYKKRELDSGNLEPYVKRYLKPAEDHVFFSSPPEPLLVPFVQFLMPDASGKYAYMQNGRQVYPRKS